MQARAACCGVSRRVGIPCVSSTSFAVSSISSQAAAASGGGCLRFLFFLLFLGGVLSAIWAFALKDHPERVAHERAQARPGAVPALTGYSVREILKNYRFWFLALILLLLCAGLFARLARVITRAQGEVLPGVAPRDAAETAQKPTVRLVGG